MRVLICGGLGFKAVNFTMYLLDKYKDCFVVSLDKETDNSKLDFRYLGDHYRNFNYIKGDINNNSLIKQVLRDFEIEYVVNFAEYGYKGDEDAEFLNVNTIALYQLLEECRLYSVDKFVQVSTNQVYGSLPNGEASEETLLKPVSLYGASKAGGDLLCQSFYNTYGFPVSIVRISDCFGPYQNEKYFIPRAITNAIKNERISIYGDGLNVREWIYIADAVEAIDRILMVGRIGQIYNLGGDHRKRDIEVIEFILDYLDKQKNLLYYRGEKIGLYRKRILDSSKLRREALWRPKYGFLKALEDTIEWYIRNYS